MSSKNKGKKYEDKVIRNLSTLLIINSLVYLIYSPRLIDLNIDIVTEIVTEIRDIVSFNYNVNIFALINFFLIALAAVKILFIGRRLPIMLILVLMFIIKFDDVLVLKLGENAVFVRNILDTYCSKLDVFSDLVGFKYNVEYSNYLISICMPVYFFLKKITYNALFNRSKKIIGSTKKKNNATFKNTTKQNNITSSKHGGYKVNNTPSTYSSNYYGDLYNDNNYSDLDDRTYTRNNLSGNKEAFAIMSDYDKERAYEMSMIDPFGKVVDESGIEMYAWEYGNIYEEEKRQEEFNFQQEQFSYTSNNDYDYRIYNPYDNNDTYSSSYDNNDTYNSGYDDYYGNSYDNNDSWF